MLKVEAIVRPERISQVTPALTAAGCTGFHYTNVTGQGRQGGVEVFIGRGGQMTTRSAVPKTLITTVIPDHLLERVIDAILETARTPGEGSEGDGKIFVSPVSEVVRVSSGERGELAI